MTMQIKAGYEISLSCAGPTPLIGLLSVHPSRAGDVLQTTGITTNQASPLRSFFDTFGNVCTRTTALEGTLTLSTDFVIGVQDGDTAHAEGADEVPVDELPDDVVQYLLGSRYCETDKLSPVAWSLFGGTTRGYDRVQAIVSYVQEHIAFGYEYASATRSAWGAYHERCGVFRDFVHLAVAFARCMNIPARYCTGYLVDSAVAESDDPVDFSPWFEAYLAGHWYTFDPRRSVGPAARVLMAAARDAADVPIYTTFGPSELIGFRVFGDVV